MSEIENSLDFSLNDTGSDETAVGSVSAASVPRYVLYGETGARADWFVNVERLDERCRERGWEIKPHTHPHFLQIGVCTEAGGEITLEGQVHPFRPGSVMVVPPYRIHGFRYEPNANGWMLTVEKGYLEDLLVRAPVLKGLLDAPRLFDLAEPALSRIGDEFVQLREEMAEQRHGRAIAAEIHLQAILLQMLRHCPESSVTSPAAGSRYDTVERFKALVEARYRQQPLLPDMAATLGVSVSQLRLACNEVTGLSPNALIHARTVAEAKRCLAYTGMTISELSDWLGFSDVAYFSRFFTRKVGETPSGYRRAQRFGSVVVEG